MRGLGATFKCCRYPLRKRESILNIYGICRNSWLAINSMPRPGNRGRPGLPRAGRLWHMRVHLSDSTPHMGITRNPFTLTFDNGPAMILPISQLEEGQWHPNFASAPC